MVARIAGGGETHHEQRWRNLDRLRGRRYRPATLWSKASLAAPGAFPRADVCAELRGQDLWHADPAQFHTRRRQRVFFRSHCSLPTTSLLRLSGQVVVIDSS
jgi:hypothetical protein